MTAHERELAFARRGTDRAHHGLVQRRNGCEGPLRHRGFGDPRRQFEGVADGGTEVRRGRAVQVGKGVKHAGPPSMPPGPPL